MAVVFSFVFYAFSLFCLVRLARRLEAVKRELTAARDALAKKDHELVTVRAERDFLTNANQRLTLDISGLPRLARERDEATADVEVLREEVEELRNGKRMLRCRSKGAIDEARRWKALATQRAKGAP